MCSSGCGLLQTCCGGSCISDPCNTLHCPEDTHCTLNSACAPSCETNPASPKDQIVGAGGGGFGCAVAGSDTSSTASAWLLLLCFGALVARRRARQAEVRR
jgi:MYXO-CTERM domain-containing protein